jgi:hypothetical protein
MSASVTKSQQLAVGIALLAIGALLAGATSRGNAPTGEDDVTLVRTEKLAPCPARR